MAGPHAHLGQAPGILAPLLLTATEKGTNWAEAMMARPVMGTDGTLTIALGEGENYRVLPLLTGFFGAIGSLFKGIWDQPEMQETLETDDNFEIVASTIKAIYDQTCRSCGLINRIIIYMPKDGKAVRKLRIDHKLGDTPAKQKWLRPDKRQSEEAGPIYDKRQKAAALVASGMTAHGGKLPTGEPLPPAHGGGTAATGSCSQGPRAKLLFGCLLRWLGQSL